MLPFLSAALMRVENDTGWIVYPRQFGWDVSFQKAGGELHLCCLVAKSTTNATESGLGGHPGFLEISYPEPSVLPQSIIVGYIAL